VKRTPAIAALFASATLVAASLARADDALVPQPVITLNATVSTAVANDRMQVSLRAEAENADPARAGSDVNAKMARAISRAKAAAGIDVATTGYSTYPVYDKDQKPTRWHASQSLSIEGADFAAVASLATALQADGGLLVSGVSFSVSTATRRKEEDALTGSAIRQWQERAASVARAFGAAKWRTGRVTVEASGTVRPQQPMMRSGVAVAQSAPMVVEGGTSEISVTVSGEAILDDARPSPR
jgi:predicted secreted protein